MVVGSGYTQKDVQELARILTGVGVDLKPTGPKLNPARQALYVRAGLFEFNPNRHDFGDKQFLGHTIKGSGFSEVEQALEKELHEIAEKYGRLADEADRRERICVPSDTDTVDT